MPVTIAILGLGRLGASLGLGLAAREAVRVAAFDPDPEIAKAAQSRGVVRKAEWNINNAVAGADLVILAVPLAEQRAMLQTIAPGLREGAVVCSLSSLLGPPLAWAAEVLPAGGELHFVAGHPVLNPAQLNTDAVGLAAASADLFKGGLWALAPAPGCAPEALKLVADLVQLVNAAPYFADPHEHDGLVAATEGLPALLAEALFAAATASPGWNEARKVADRAFSTATAALAEADPAALRLNRANVLRYLDAALAELQALRRRLADDNSAALGEALADAGERRASWLYDRQQGKWEAAESATASVPTTGELMTRLLVGRLFGRKGERDEDH